MRILLPPRGCTRSMKHLHSIHQFPHILIVFFNCSLFNRLCFCLVSGTLAVKLISDPNAPSPAPPLIPCLNPKTNGDRRSTHTRTAMPAFQLLYHCTTSLRQTIGPSNNATYVSCLPCMGLHECACLPAFGCD